MAGRSAAGRLAGAQTHMHSGTACSGTACTAEQRHRQASRKVQASPALAEGMSGRRAQQQQGLQHQGRPCHSDKQPAVRLLPQGPGRGREGSRQQQRQQQARNAVRLHPCTHGMFCKHAGHGWAETVCCWAGYPPQAGSCELPLAWSRLGGRLLLKREPAEPSQEAAEGPLCLLLGCFCCCSCCCCCCGPSSHDGGNLGCRWAPQSGASCGAAEVAANAGAIAAQQSATKPSTLLGDSWPEHPSSSAPLEHSHC